MGYLIKCKKQSSTIRSYLSAIKAVLKDNNIKVDTDQYLLSSLTRACRLVNDKVRQRSPICKLLLLTILRQLDKDYQLQPYLRLMYQTLFSTAYFGLFRVCELTATKSKHAVLAKDVKIGWNKKKILFILHTSKTHCQGSKPQKVKISSQMMPNRQSVDSQHRNYCPYQLLRDYFAMRGGYRSKKEQFFIFRDGSPVTAYHMRKVLKSVLKNAHEKPTMFSMHSFRVGRSLDLLKYGVSVETIKKIGHWKSNAVFAYLRF